MRRALTPAIVLFWLVMVGLLVHEQAPPPSAPQAPLATGTSAAEPLRAYPFSLSEQRRRCCGTACHPTNEKGILRAIGIPVS